MKKTLLVLFACVAAAGSAQNNYQDVVFLKNGGRVKGVIIEQVPYQSLKIETKDGNIFVYQMDEVEKMSKEVISEPNNKNNFKSRDGYRIILDLGYNIGIGDYKMDRFNVNLINGVQINPYFYAGFGLGWRVYSEMNTEVSFFPIFADFRSNFLDSATSPYFSLDVGYSLGTGGGFMLNPTFGIDIKTSGGTSLVIGVGYEMQKLDFLSFYDGNVTSENFGAIAFKLGVAF